MKDGCVRRAGMGVWRGEGRVYCLGTFLNKFNRSSSFVPDIFPAKHTDY